VIVGLITPHLIYLTIMKSVREAKARSRAMLCMYVVRECQVKILYSCRLFEDLISILHCRMSKSVRYGRWNPEDFESY
jgi:hypothetical protein